MDNIERIVVLENELEALALDAELCAADIPHAMISYHDSAYDGLFQTFKGWGHVEAPAQFREEILTILENLRESPAEVRDRDQECEPAEGED